MSKAFNYPIIGAIIDKPVRIIRPRIRLVRITFFAFFITLLLWMFYAWSTGTYRVLSDDPTVWQASIDYLNSEDPLPIRESVASPAPMVFVGSSTIRLFNGLQTIFRKNNVLKKGFGGAKIKDIVHYQNDLILQYQPRLVVFYIGTNDMLYRDYNSITDITNPLFNFLNELQQKLPETTFVLLAQRPLDHSDVSRDIHKYNNALATYAFQQNQVSYVDVNKILMNADHSINLKTAVEI